MKFLRVRSYVYVLTVTLLHLRSHVYVFTVLVPVSLINRKMRESDEWENERESDKWENERE